MNDALTRLRDQLLVEDFSAFTLKSAETVHPGTHFLPNWHIDLLADYLEACRRGEIKRLIINLPPRSLKSITVSVAWPAWILGKDPGARILAASYGHALAGKHAKDCRLLMESGWFRRLFSKTRIQAGENEKQKFVTTQRGFRLATSVGAAMIGEGGDVLIVDDPLNPRQAMSATQREHANAWFGQSFSTRLNDPSEGVIVVVMQRLHAEDLTGYLLAKESGHWEVLSLPAILETPLSLHIGGKRIALETGAALHPERLGLQTLAEIRAEIGAMAFAAQYQQQPLPEMGIVRAEWLKRFAPQDVPEGAALLQSWDTASKAASHHDQSACATFAVSGSRCYLLDLWSGRLEYPELKAKVEELASRYQPATILVEDQGSGQQLIQELGLPITPVHPKEGKETRLRQAAPLLETGKVFLPRTAHWLAEFEAELIGFPHAKHDDQLDAFVQGLLWMSRQASPGPRIRRL